MKEKKKPKSKLLRPREAGYIAPLNVKTQRPRRWTANELLMRQHVMGTINQRRWMV